MKELTTIAEEEVLKKAGVLEAIQVSLRLVQLLPCKHKPCKQICQAEIGVAHLLVGYAEHYFNNNHHLTNTRHILNHYKRLVYK